MAIRNKGKIAEAITLNYHIYISVITLLKNAVEYKNSKENKGKILMCLTEKHITYIYVGHHIRRENCLHPFFFFLLNCSVSVVCLV